MGADAGKSGILLDFLGTLLVRLAIDPVGFVSTVVLFELLPDADVPLLELEPELVESSPLSVVDDGCTNDNFRLASFS